MKEQIKVKAKEIELQMKSVYKDLQEIKKVFKGLSQESIDILSADEEYLDNLKEEINIITDVSSVKEEIEEAIELMDIEDGTCKKYMQKLIGYLEILEDIQSSSLEGVNSIDLVDSYIEILRKLARITK